MQSALVLDSLKLATEVLAPKGVFVTKIFRYGLMGGIICPECEHTAREHTLFAA